MSDKKPSAQPPIDASRRRILQGAVSVPVVLTVTNASAQAATSAFQCRTDLNPEATPPADVGTECLGDGSVVSSPVTPFTHQGAGSALRDFNSAAPGSDGKNCIAYIRQDGTHYFATDSGQSGGVPVTASCYTSFVP